MTASILLLQGMRKRPLPFLVESKDEVELGRKSERERERER